MALAVAAQSLGVSPRGGVTAPRLIAVDLDGTLLDVRGQPHANDVRALRAALSAGIRVSIITGRLYSGTRPVAELLGLSGAVGCADGSHLVDARLHATLLHLGVRGTEARLLRELFARARLTTFVFAQDAIGHDAAGAPFVEYVTTWSTDLRPALDVFEHPLWESDNGVTAVIALGTRDRLGPVVDEIARCLPSASVVAQFPVRRHAHTGTWAVIVRAAGGTKGTALRWIAEREGVALKDTVCVGDWINDVTMFEEAGRSFAMGQAPDEVKGKATDVLSETVEGGGGVAHAVEAAFGIVEK
jgi:hydroxymethylpyrimidine pyrophosphatase-like HAD family hydrolase